MSKKKTKRCTPLCKSQLAHERLRRKHSRKKGRMSKIKADYHESMIRRQNFVKRILSSSEKKKLFDSCKFYS